MEFDLVPLLNRSFMHDPYPTLATLRRDHAAIPVANGGFRMWVITRYEDAKALLTDPTLHRDLVKHRHDVVGQNLIDIERRPRLPRELRRSMLDQDGADHHRMRAVVAKFFTPSRLRALRPRTELLAGEILDGLPTGHPLDIIGAYTRPLSVTCLSEMLGVPEHMRVQFPRWETAILTAPSKREIEQAGVGLRAFAEEIVALKRAEPAEDLFTTVVLAADNGVLDDAELTSMITLLLIAGLEPASAIGSGVLTLLRHPGELARLRADPDLITACVEEVLRFETPFRMLTPRYVDHPVELDGVTVPAGELLLISTGSANRDPARFTDPDRFDITRDMAKHLGFSHGSHRCMGAELGRMETAVALAALFERYPDTRLAGTDAEAQWRPGMFMRRLDSLSVVLA